MAKPANKKARWGVGAWSNEPDEKVWTDAATGLPCVAYRHPSLGHWCGYVGVPSDHSLCSKDYDHSGDVTAHGGLTYADDHAPTKPTNEAAWWFGFDCAHHMDLVPGAQMAGDDGTYRDLTFVEKQCASLAQQLKSTP